MGRNCPRQCLTFILSNPMGERPVSLSIPDKLLPILEPKRFKIMHGGRGGGKSHTVAQVLLAMGLQRPLRVLCVREVQKSLAESSMQVIKDYIGRLGLSDYYDVLKSEIKAVTGTSFAFAGLQDHTAESIKSYEGVDIVWVEEAQSVSTNSWNILIPTIRKAGSEIWATFNPTLEDDYVYQRFVIGNDPDAWVAQINWRDNPWFGKEMDAERVKTRAMNEDLYQHVWEGACKSIAGFLFKREWMRRYERAPSALNIYMSGDFAVTQGDGDFTELAVWGVSSSGMVYVLDWWAGQQQSDVWVSILVDMAARWKPFVFIGETGQIRRSIEPMLNREMRERQQYVACTWLSHEGNKIAHASSMMGLMSSGAVLWPSTPWANRVIDQLCSFTGEDGRIDDAVDACSLFARFIHKTWNATEKPKEPAVDFARMPTIGEMMQPRPSREGAL